jgi:hypothetical protein
MTISEESSSVLIRFVGCKFSSTNVASTCGTQLSLGIYSVALASKLYEDAISSSVSFCLQFALILFSISISLQNWIV